MSLKKKDFSKICRMCLLFRKELLTLYVPELIEMIKNCTGIEVKLDDGLPQAMCFECSEQIQQYAAFRQRCKNSDKILHEIINENENYDSHSDANEGINYSNIARELEDDVKEELSDCDSNAKSVSDSYSYDNGKRNMKTKVLDMPIKKELEVSETQELLKEENITKTSVQFHSRILEDNSYIKDENFDSNKFMNDNVEFDSYFSHMKSETEVDKGSVNCKICKKNILENSFDDHLKNHKLKKKQKCDQCFKAFRKPCELAKHLNDVHKRKKTIECQVCSKTFHLQIQLDLHLKLHFKTKHICNVCGKEFAKSSKLLRHKKIHENREKIFCLHCDKIFISDDSFKTHVKLYHNTKSSGKEKKTCPTCGKVVVNIKRHTMQIHSNNRAYKCDQCEKSFICNSLLTKHVEEKHLGVKKELKALCFICGKACPSQGDLKKHLPSHDDNREYDCNLCNKKYKSRNGLRCHLKVHKGIRPFSCTICSKKYFTNKDLQQHHYVHTGERPFACPICGRTFNYKAARWTHMKVHDVLIITNKNNSTNV